MLEYIRQEMDAHRAAFEVTANAITGEISSAGQMIIDSLVAGGKLLVCGNGGSAADAQHMAAELVGLYLQDRPGFSAIALGSNTSTLTAIANDLGYDAVFSRQVEAIARPGDVVMGISTSGRSPNVLKALECGRKIGCKTLALSGCDGGDMNRHADVHINIPHFSTPRIQEMHAVVTHILCGITERGLARS